MPFDLDLDTDRARAAVLRITRTDDIEAFAATAAGPDIGAIVPPMPTWTTGSRFGMCRNPKDTR